MNFVRLERRFDSSDEKTPLGIHSGPTLSEAPPRMLLNILMSPCVTADPQTLTKHIERKRSIGQLEIAADVNSLVMPPKKQQSPE